ncbi:hypothetical protein JMUB7504_27300 [Staphylococcus aureus]
MLDANALTSSYDIPSTLTSVFYSTEKEMLSSAVNSTGLE